MLNKLIMMQYEFTLVSESEGKSLDQVLNLSVRLIDIYRFRWITRFMSDSHENQD